MAEPRIVLPERLTGRGVVLRPLRDSDSGAYTDAFAADPDSGAMARDRASPGSIVAARSGSAAPARPAPRRGPRRHAAVLSGACFAPVSTVQTAAVQEVAAAGHQGDASSWVGTVYGAGSALGATVAGQLVVAAGTRAAFVAAASGTALAWLVLAARRTALTADTAAPR